MRPCQLDKDGYLSQFVSAGNDSTNLPPDVDDILNRAVEHACSIADVIMVSADLFLDPSDGKNCLDTNRWKLNDQHRSNVATDRCKKLGEILFSHVQHVIVFATEEHLQAPILQLLEESEIASTVFNLDWRTWHRNKESGSPGKSNGAASSIAQVDMRPAPPLMMPNLNRKRQNFDWPIVIDQRSHSFLGRNRRILELIIKLELCGATVIERPMQQVDILLSSCAGLAFLHVGQIASAEHSKENMASTKSQLDGIHDIIYNQALQIMQQASASIAVLYLIFEVDSMLKTGWSENMLRNRLLETAQSFSLTLHCEFSSESSPVQTILLRILNSFLNFWHSPANDLLYGIGDPPTPHEEYFLSFSSVNAHSAALLASYYTPKQLYEELLTLGADKVKERLQKAVPARVLDPFVRDFLHRGLREFGPSHSRRLAPDRYPLNVGSDSSKILHESSHYVDNNAMDHLSPIEDSLRKNIPLIDDLLGEPGGLNDHNATSIRQGNDAYALKELSFYAPSEIIMKPMNHSRNLQPPNEIHASLQTHGGAPGMPQVSHLRHPNPQYNVDALSLSPKNIISRPTVDSFYDKEKWGSMSDQVGDGGPTSTFSPCRQVAQNFTNHQEDARLPPGWSEYQTRDAAVDEFGVVLDPADLQLEDEIASSEDPDMQVATEGRYNEIQEDIHVPIEYDDPLPGLHPNAANCIPHVIPRQIHSFRDQNGCWREREHSAALVVGNDGWTQQHFQQFHNEVRLNKLYNNADSSPANGSSAVARKVSSFFQTREHDSLGNGVTYLNYCEPQYQRSSHMASARHPTIENRLNNGELDKMYLGKPSDSMSEASSREKSFSMLKSDPFKPPIIESPHQNSPLRLSDALERLNKFRYNGRSKHGDKPELQGRPLAKVPTPSELSHPRKGSTSAKGKRKFTTRSFRQW